MSKKKEQRLYMMIDIYLPQNTYKQPTAKQQLAQQKSDENILGKWIQKILSDDIVLVHAKWSAAFLTFDAINIYNLQEEFQIYISYPKYPRYEISVEFYKGNRRITANSKDLVDAIQKKRINQDDNIVDIIEQEIKFNETIGAKPYIKKFVRER